MSVDPVLVVYGVVVARAVYDRYGARIASEYDVLQRRLRRFSRRVARAANGAVAKAAGARDVESALRDLGDVNAALARLATALGLGTDGGRARFRAALSYDEGKCPRWAPTFARKALAECGVDFEAVGVDRETDAREGRVGRAMATRGVRVRRRAAATRRRRDERRGGNRRGRGRRRRRKRRDERRGRVRDRARHSSGDVRGVLWFVKADYSTAGD